MLTEFSHILAFSMLFISSVFDVRSELGDVPDVFAAVAVIGGVVLHGAQSFLTGSWLPLVYCLAVGTAFSAYGWAAYWKGLWGGADAFAMSALGFGAPFLTASASGVILHAGDLVMNLLGVAVVYSVAFSVLRAYRTEGFLQGFREVVVDNRFRAALFLGAGLSVFVFFDFFRAFMLYGLLMAGVLVTYFLRAVEDYAMVEEVDVDDLEGGEVLKGERIRGVTEEEIDEMEGTVEVMHGLRFLPVFPVALLLTDAGFSILVFIISL
ncbi:MAG: hypothetical protein ABEJ95_06895 [Candidatus Nanohalobium sp.]